MNKELRLKLIERAKKKRTMTYAEAAKIIGLGDLSDGGARRILSRALGEISEYEHENGRPLLSAIAIYSNTAATGSSLTDIHGGGFYGIAESLGLGPKSKLAKDGYGIQAMNEAIDFWSDPMNAEEHLDNPAFFTNQDILNLKKYSSFERYLESDQEHIVAAKYITETIAPKVDYWASEVVSRLDGFTYSFKNNWNQPSGPGKFKFKPYSWARLYKNSDKQKQIFFTVGINGPELRLDFKLDFRFSSDVLSDSQKDIIRSNIPTHLRMIAIDIGDIKDYNWESLIDETSNMFQDSIYAYDNLIQLAWEIKPSSEEKVTKLVRHAPPDASSMVQLSDDDFSPVYTDYEKAAKNKKVIGDAGEDLVVKFEKEHLSNFPELAKEVKKVDDGVGYDIISRNVDSSPKYIEVKTTTKTISTPFFISRRELNFALKNRENYIIYRLYDFNKENTSSKYYEITDVANSLDLQPTEFRATLKKQ